MTKKWIQIKTVNSCAQCPDCETEEDTLGPEAYTTECRTNYIKYVCQCMENNIGMMVNGLEQIIIEFLIGVL